jgi:peptide/nickel transport system substrate-binding protein
MTHSFDRRSFLAGGLALGAGATMAGTLGQAGEAGAAATNGPGRNGVSNSRPKLGGSLTFGIDTEESGFSPTEARWDEGGFLYGRSLFDPLAIVNAAGGVEPYLAQSITANGDYTQFTVTLRPGITFHDGTPLDANALNLNFEKQATSALVGPAFANNIASTSVSGPLSVLLTMKGPWAPFPYYLAQAQTGYVAAPSMLNSPNGNENPIGTGPFTFGSWVPNSHMSVTKNSRYWRKGYPYLDAITYKPIIDSNSRDQALQTGEIDIEHTGTPESILLFRGNKKWSYYDNSGQVLGQPTVQCIMLNTSAPPFDNHQLRVAMAQSVNQKQFVAVINKNVDAPMHGLFIPGSEYYSSTSYPAYNPSAAAKAVKAVKASGKPVSFTLFSTSNPDVLRAAQFLQQAWQQAGMQVNIQVLAQSALINNALGGKYQATLWRQFGAVDPDLNYVWWTPALTTGPLALNMARNVDPRIQAALLTGRRTDQHPTRIKAYRQINEYLAQDVPYIWLARDTWAVVANPKVQNFVNPKTIQGSKAFAFDEGVLWPTQIWIS